MYSLISLLFFGRLWLTLSHPLITEVPRIQTSLGPITGTFEKSHLGRKYAAFQGVPYAKPPVGDKRFQPPEPIQGWTVDLIADRPRSKCVQYEHHSIETPPYPVLGDEDCLYMDIYVPKTNETQLLPVTFFIHGGAFQYGGGSSFKPTFLMDKDIIVVTINYRLGALGFLSTEDHVVTGNMGLKDQSMALEWVRQNIGAFGGDPDKIQLSGFSAGGASVHYHYLSPMSKGNFKCGISFSGLAMNSWTQAEKSREKAMKLGSLLKCPTKNTTELIGCLKRQKAYDIAAATYEFQPWLYNPFTPFGPVVEKESPKPFIDRKPVDIVASGDAADVPWVTGDTTEEGLYPASEYVARDDYLRDLDENWEKIAPHLLDFENTIPQGRQIDVAREIRAHYYGSKHINSSTVYPLVKMVGDRLFFYNTEDAVRLQARKNKNPVYFYVYGYRATDSLSQYYTNSTKDYGVAHSDDISLVFDSSMMERRSPRDFEMQNKLMDFMVSFANTGVPDFGVPWTRVDPDKREFEYLFIGGPSQIFMTASTNLGDRKFWRSIEFQEDKF